ncbi:carboxypeptidase-like regulatory domain-containing protein [Pontibacter harenae]|uniref:carboxypeptidase-like regulatory domain-containing protein n=1 Tax=Pontibacter harenae TaxID=2894083 RepID=UPI001E5C9FB8|nr:carboxypeptidase-like regulatory domain-containing protein [Pontibacter harenae]MCC9167154.1 carboxypeptidase-like regulatory domain-containing protein [Pontibacter harenae]
MQHTTKGKATANSLLIVLSIMAILFVAAVGEAAAQVRQQVVQLSGFVVLGDSMATEAGVAVYIPTKNRGTQTAANGYYTLPVSAGDSVVYSALGYQKKCLVIPESSAGQNYTVHIKLLQSATELPTVQVMPWATERDFKQAVLKVELPKGPHINTNFPMVAPKSILDIAPMDAEGNFKMFKQQQTQRQESRFKAPDVIRIF